MKKQSRTPVFKNQPILDIEQALLFNMKTTKLPYWEGKTTAKTVHLQEANISAPIKNELPTQKQGHCTIHLKGDW